MIASGKTQSTKNPPKGAMKAFSKVLGNSITLIEPEIVVLGGGAINSNWFDINKVKKLIKQFTYPGIKQPKIVKNKITNINLRGAALLTEEKIK